MIVDGREIARDILRGVREQVELAQKQPTVRAIVQAPSGATESYLRIKEKKAAEAGMYLEVIRLENEATTEDVIAKIQLPGSDAIIVQLPLAPHVDTERVLDSIPLGQDADVLSREAREKFSKDTKALLPPVVAAIKEIFDRQGVTPSGKSVVVVGRGRLVGEPVASWLTKEGAMVTTFAKEDFDPSTLRDADIVVSGVGQARLVKKEYLKEGVVLIDAGTSESAGEILGDTEPDCADVASVYTPVPGGVGPIAVAFLFKNVLELY